MKVTDADFDFRLGVYSYLPCLPMKVGADEMGADARLSRC